MSNDQERNPPAAGMDPGLFQAMVEQAAEAIIFVDRSGLVQVWNRGAEQIFGYSTTEIRAGGLDLIVPERLRAAHWNGFNAAVANGHTKHGDRVLTTRATHKDSRKIYVYLSFCLIRDPAGVVQGALAIGRDCTERYLEEKARNIASDSGAQTSDRTGASVP